MDQPNYNTKKEGGESGCGPDPGRGSNSSDAHTGPSFAGGLGPMNPMFMGFQGMAGNMPGYPQDMMNMMGTYCQNAGVAAPGRGGMGGMGGMGGFADVMSNQGTNPAAPQMMARKRPMEDRSDEAPPAPAKRSAGAGDDVPPPDDPPSQSRAAAAPFADDRDDDEKDEEDEKPPAEPPAGSPAPGSPGPPRREHAAVPPSKEGIKFYSRNDVLCGRGGGTNVHPGNRRFRDLINANRRAYLKARKNDKPAISRSIVRTIREMNGRFLKKEEKLGLWFEIGDDGAREKTSQALRQRAPEMRKILFEDEQRQQHQQQQEMMMQRQQAMMGMGQMGGGGFSQMGPMGSAARMGGPGFASAAGMGAPGGGPAAGGGNDLSSSLLAKYNMLHQKNWLAQEKNMILQRLAMSGLSPQSLNGAQSNIDSMTTQTLLGQGMKPVTPRGA